MIRIQSFFISSLILGLFVFGYSLFHPKNLPQYKQLAKKSLLLAKNLESLNIKVAELQKEYLLMHGNSVGSLQHIRQLGQRNLGLVKQSKNIINLNLKKTGK